VFASVSVCECVRVCASGGDERVDENLGKWKCCGWKYLANFVHMIVHMQLLQHVTAAHCKALYCGQFCEKGDLV